MDQSERMMRAYKDGLLALGVWHTNMAVRRSTAINRLVTLAMLALMQNDNDEALEKLKELNEETDRLVSDLDEGISVIDSFLLKSLNDV